MVKEGRSNASDSKSKTQRTRSFTIDITMIIIVAPKSLMALAHGIFYGSSNSSPKGQKLLNKFLRDFFSGHSFKGWVLALNKTLIQ